MAENKETVEGYVVDAACIRSYPTQGRADRARAHTRDCALMGHCVESGYGLIDDDGRIAMLDPKATPLVQRTVRDSGRVTGIRLRATREQHGEKMETTHVEEVAAE